MYINILNLDKILKMSSEYFKIMYPYIIERRRGGVLLVKKYVTEKIQICFNVLKTSLQKSS